MQEAHECQLWGHDLGTHTGDVVRDHICHFHNARIARILEFPVQGVSKVGFELLDRLSLVPYSLEFFLYM